MAKKKTTDKKTHGGGTPPTGAAPTSEPAVEKRRIRLSDLQAQRQGNSAGGIRCPSCGCADLRDPLGPGWEITHTKKVPGAIRRRRVCRNCGKAVRTRETLDKAL